MAVSLSAIFQPLILSECCFNSGFLKKLRGESCGCSLQIGYCPRTGTLCVRQKKDESYTVVLRQALVDYNMELYWRIYAGGWTESYN